MKRTHLGKISLYILSLFIILSFTLPGDKSIEYSQSIELFNSIFKEVNSFYVEEVDPDELVRVGIDAMLKSLDPYTNYIPNEKLDQFNAITTGEFYGIGASIGQVNGRNVILMPLEGYPAYAGGLMRGDEIIEVDGVNVQDKSDDFIGKLLKKEGRGNVTIKVKRFGVDGYLEKTLKIDKIKIRNVSYYGKVADDIGYIKLDEFTSGAADEVRSAVLRLKAKKAKRFILDLRDNPGGLLNEAIQVCNIFIPKGKTVVSIRGKATKWNKTYSAYTAPLDTVSPIAVLINENSASAAEIVAGVIQDYDRGLLIGKKTYGKGLVQATLPISQTSKLKITTAKFYIPSGRCIQNVDYGREDSVAAADRVYYTQNKRAVKAADGIAPDVKVEKGEAPDLIAELQNKGLIFDFASAYHYNHPSFTPDPKTFSLSDRDYERFKSWLEERDFKYDTDAERAYVLFNNLSKTESLYPEIEAQMNEIRSKIDAHKSVAFDLHKQEIKALLEQEIISRYHMDEGKIEVSIKHDEAVHTAVKALSQSKKYNSMLRISTEI